MLEQFAESFGVDPDYEGKVLDEIKKAVDERKKHLKFDLGIFLGSLVKGFAYLWGKEDISPEARKALAICFTLIACLFGIYYTKSNWFGVTKSTITITPGLSGSICALLIYGALSARNYLPRPFNFQSIIFFAADIFLFGS